MKQKLSGNNEEGRTIRLVFAFGLIGLVMVTFASAARAQTTAVGPYYANPSWDQQLPVATRFIVLSNWIDTSFPSGGAAVLDRETGLVWQRAASVRPGFSLTEIWTAALESCRASTTGNRRGWRLPKVEELASLIDPTLGDIPAGNPFNYVSQQLFWTATSQLAIANQAYMVRAGGNPIFNIAFGAKTSFAGFWCVRGGPGLDVQ